MRGAGRLADAQKVKGLAPLACKTDKIDARVLAELSWRDLVPAIWLPDAERYQRTKQRLGRQRGPKVAQIDLSRKLTEAIWQMLTATSPALRQAPIFI